MIIIIVIIIIISYTYSYGSARLLPPSLLERCILGGHGGHGAQLLPAAHLQLPRLDLRPEVRAQSPLRLVAVKEFNSSCHSKVIEQVKDT